jgi:uroporphyrinogen decarboxylase
MITPRERVRIALQHRQPDRVPYNFEFTVPSRRKVEAYYGTADVDGLLGNHLAVTHAYTPDSWQEVTPDLWRDQFGVIWNRSVDPDIGVVENVQLKARTLAGYTFPDPHDPRRYAHIPAWLEEHPDQYRLLSIGFSLYERAWTLRSMAELLVDMLEAPEWVDELLDAITDFNMGLMEHALQYDFDGIRFGDDWGQQRGLQMGPRLWRRFIKPRLARMYGAVKQSGKTVFIHCCGKVQELFPDLIEIGLDCFNPFQPEVMDPYEIKKQYGQQLSFYGGMSIQHILPHGTAQQVREEAKCLMDKVGAGGGYIIGPSHGMPGDIPIENLVAFIETVRGG